MEWNINSTLKCSLWGVYLRSVTTCTYIECHGLQQLLGLLKLHQILEFVLKLLVLFCHLQHVRSHVLILCPEFIQLLTTIEKNNISYQYVWSCKNHIIHHIISFTNSFLEPWGFISITKKMLYRYIVFKFIN